MQHGDVVRVSEMRKELVFAVVALLGCARPERVASIGRTIDFTTVPLAEVRAGDRVTVLSEQPGKNYLYYRVRLRDGREGVMIWDPDTFPATDSTRKPTS